MAKKVTTTISIHEDIRNKLRQQAEKVGMDVSNYIAYLVMYKEEKDKQEANTREMTADLIKALGSLGPQAMAQLIKNKGDE